MSSEDEELARRLQFEEHTFSSSYRGSLQPAPYPEPLLDADLARHYARLYLEQQGKIPSMDPPGMDRYVPSIHDLQRHRDLHPPHTDRSSAFPHQTLNQRGYGDVDSYSVNDYAYNRATLSRTDPSLISYDSVQYPGTRTSDSYGYDGRLGLDNRRLVSSSDIHYARELQEKAFQDISRKGAEPLVASLSNTEVYSNDEARRASTADLDYARRLQELAFSDLERKKPAMVKEPMNEKDGRNGDNFDAQLARKMQALENQGLGRLNSDRKLEVLELVDETELEPKVISGIGDVSSNQLTYRLHSSIPVRNNDDERLAYFLEQSELSISQIPSDVLMDVMKSGPSDDTKVLENPTSSRHNRNQVAVQSSNSANKPLSSLLSSQVHKSSQGKDNANGSSNSGPEQRPDLPIHRMSLSNLSENSSSSLQDDPSASSNPASDVKKVKRNFLGFGNKKNNNQSKNDSSNRNVALNKNTTSIKSSDSANSGGGQAVPLSSYLGSSTKTTKSKTQAKTKVPINGGKPLRALLAVDPGSTRSGAASAGRSSDSVSSASASSYKDSTNLSSSRNLGSPPPSVIHTPQSSGSLLSSTVGSLQPTQNPPNRGLPLVVPSRREPAGVPPRAIPPPPAGMPNSNLNAPHMTNNIARDGVKQKLICAGCGQSGGSFLKALDNKYHPECFRCVSCNGNIDPNSQFKFSTDPLGRRHPHHLDCFVKTNGIQCSVCHKTIASSPDGKVAFVKHPFFTTEHICVHHADVPHRRCSGCQRFEPEGKPFINLMDGNRCICPACCRTVVFDSAEGEPLWKNVIYFLEFKLKLPVWDQMREIPILLVGSDELTSQMRAEKSIHAYSHQVMTSGLCLTSYNNRRVSVVAVLALMGLPRDLTMSILVREATLAWFKLHPKYDIENPLPAQIEEGIAQLMAFLFLSEAIRNFAAADDAIGEDDDGPSDGKLRQYFRFLIERDSHEIYGTGYRRAAIAFRDVGIEELLNHVLKYRDFPKLSPS